MGRRFIREIGFYGILLHLYLCSSVPKAFVRCYSNYLVTHVPQCHGD